MKESNIEQMTTISGDIKDDTDDSEEGRMLKRIREAENIIGTIAEIIWAEMPLRYQDAWLEDIMNKGIWRPDPDLVEGMKKEEEDGDDEE
jgi:hypothetical protein